jgi:hypothetical protein
LVLTIGLRRWDRHLRWKEIVKPYPEGLHHLELHSISDIDDEVRGWIGSWEAAG